MIFGLLNSLFAYGQTQDLQEDSLAVSSPLQAIADSSRKDTSRVIDPASEVWETREDFEDLIDYTATDSIIGYGTGTFYLYGNAKINYGEDVKLEADFIRLNMDSGMVYASGRRDSVGDLVGKPIFTDKGTTYETEQITYNFNTGKAFIYKVVTEQGEGFVTGKETKRINDEAICMRNGRYTTCDRHDHPHFYMQMTKAKVRPGKNIVTGPAYMVIEDVPLPLVLPFGYFPFTSSFSSGFIVPTIGEENTRGFYLQDGGYYWAASDYFDFRATGDIYSKGSWGLYAQSNYKKRYAYSGSFRLSYLMNVLGEKDLPDYSKTKDFKLTWSHKQDAKADPYKTFSASVNFASSSYDFNNVNTPYNPSTRSQNTKKSSISYSQRFPDSPWRLSGNMSASQNSSDSTYSLNLPSLTIAMNSITPFKRKKRVGKTRWYEKIRMGYTGTISNSIRNVQLEEIAESNFFRDWKNGAKHQVSTSTSFNALKYITVSPNASYTERWYAFRFDKSYDQELDEVDTDTVMGFNRVWDYRMGVGASTKLFTFYTPVRWLFGEKIKAVRHVMSPSVNFSYNPDFSTDFYGYYGTYDEYNEDLDTTYVRSYSHYDGSLYGTPSSVKSGSVSIGIGNNVEMKIKSDRDSIGGERKIKLLESLNFSTSYNLAADSLNWSNLSVRGRTRLTKSLAINFGATFDPYLKDTTSAGNLVRVNRMHWKYNNKVGQLTSANMSFGYSLNNKTFSRKETSDKKTGAEGEGGQKGEGKPEGEPEKESPVIDPNGYVPFSMPWNVSFNYSYRLQGTFSKDDMRYHYKNLSNVRLSGSVSLTQKWKINASTGYDLSRKEMASTNFSVSRDLHCWSMSMNFVPFGKYKSYNFLIRVNSSMLSDVKYDRRSSPYDNPGWTN